MARLHRMDLSDPMVHSKVCLFFFQSSWKYSINFVWLFLITGERSKICQDSSSMRRVGRVSFHW